MILHLRLPNFKDEKDRAFVKSALQAIYALEQGALEADRSERPKLAEAMRFTMRHIESIIDDGLD